MDFSKFGVICLKIKARIEFFLIFNWTFKVKSASLPHERKSIIH